MLSNNNQSIGGQVYFRLLHFLASIFSSERMPEDQMSIYLGHILILTKVLGNNVRLKLFMLCTVKELKLENKVRVFLD